MIYGADVWYTPPTKPIGAKRNQGSVAALRGLAKTQRIATLAITGSLRTTPSDLIEIQADVFPIELTLLKTTHRAAIRLCTLPETHLLHETINEAVMSQPSKHFSPIDNLLNRFQLNPSKFERINPCIKNPNDINEITTKLEEKVAATKSEENDNADYRIYSDGSGNEENIGAAAVMYKKGRKTPIKTLQFYLGSSEHHNTFEAEGVGSLLGTWLLRTTPETRGKMVTLFTDNQALVLAIRSNNVKSGQHIITELTKMAKDLSCALTIKWIPGHSEIAGNDKADELAKEAAERKSSRSRDLPLLLRKPLPTNASSAKLQFHKEMIKKWKTMWNASPRKARIDAAEINFPFSNYKKELNKLNREQFSRIVQVSSRHIPLNAYLHRIGKSPTRNCQQCLTIQGERPTPETTNHYIFDCPAYAEERWELEKALGRKELNLKNLMENADTMKALTKYISRTKRLKSEG